MGADLSAFVKIPIKGSIENKLENKANQTFQALSEKNTASHMLLKTVQCFNEQENGKPLANHLATYLMNNKQCEPSTEPPERKIFANAMSGEWVGVSNQIVEDNLPVNVDLAVAPHSYREETVNLTLKDGVVSCSIHGQSEWECSGYLRDGFLVLAYRTAGPQGRGFGTRVLENKKGDGEVYVGYVEGRECVIGKIVKYPYILIKGKPNSKEVERAKKDYAKVLNQHGVEVDLSVCK